MQLRSIEERGESRVLLVFVCISNFYILMGKDETDSSFFFVENLCVKRWQLCLQECVCSALGWLTYQLDYL